MSELLEVRDRALVHYAKRLRYLAQDKDEQIQSGNDIIKNDLFVFADKIQKLVGERRESYITDNNQIISDAFSCYLKDLEQSKKAICNKLPYVNPIFTQVDKEVEMIKAALADLL
jgi:hypothetical protein